MRSRVAYFFDAKTNTNTKHDTDIDTSAQIIKMQEN
jgi:hypothetical protein